jgi:hypothetical protein
LAVLFKFKPNVSEEHRASFVKGVRALRELPSVLNRQLYVGGPSVTDPIEKSKGFQIALVSVHPDLAALTAYHASEEHERYVLFSTVNVRKSTSRRKKMYVVDVLSCAG